MKIYPVIMCGGSGTRLWPVSTAKCPKQFVRLLSEHSLFQQTALRLGAGADSLEFADPVIISNGRYLGLIEEQLAEIGVPPLAILLEPCPRNTAAVAAIAANFVARTDPDGLVLLLPSDHFIGQPGKFREAVGEAIAVAGGGRIVTFGVSPDRPETGFGYIKAGAPLGGSAYRVDAFREKPDHATALSYLAEGSYTWNAGMFLFPARLMQQEFSVHAPDVLETASRALDRASVSGRVHALDEESFAQTRSISIDYAVMENTHNAAVLGPLSCAWSDVGTWPAVGDLQESNSPVAPVLIDVENCTIHSDTGTLVAAMGVSDLVISIHEGSVLVMPKSRSQDVSLIIEALKSRGLTDRF